jgi:alpha-mannosidase
VQHWADVSDGQMGVTLSAIESHLLEFGGLWPCYVSQAHHGVTPPDFGRDFVKPEELTKGHIYAFVINSNFRTNFQPVQQDDMLFHYSVTTHKGGWKQGQGVARPSWPCFHGLEARATGWSAANPLVGVVVEAKSAKGGLEKTMSFCRVDVPNVFLLTLKRAEDGNGVIVRLIETEGQEVTAEVTLPHLSIKKAYRTNLAEENEAELAFTEHSVTVPVKAFGISTIRIIYR